MSFTATPTQVKLLRQAVTDYCRDCGIDDDQEREYVAELVSSLFDLGALDLDDPRRGLEAAMGPRSRIPALNLSNRFVGVQ